MRKNYKFARGSWKMMSLTEIAGLATTHNAKSNWQFARNVVTAVLTHRVMKWHVHGGPKTSLSLLSYFVCRTWNFR